MANNDTILYTLRESGSYTVVASNSSYGSDYDSDATEAIEVNTQGSVPGVNLADTAWRFYETNGLVLTDCEFTVNFVSDNVEYIGIKVTDGEIYYRDLSGEYIKVFAKPAAAMFMYRVRLNTQIEGTSTSVEQDPDYSGSIDSTSHNGGSND